MSAPAFKVRRATPEDIPAMLAVINAAFAIETFLEGTRTNREGLMEMMERGEFLLAHEGSGKLAASVYVEKRGRRGYFGMLAVDPGQQGKGLSRKMVEAAEEYFRERGCEALDLTVLSLRPELPPLYRKFGFAETGTEEFLPSRPLKPGFAGHCIVMSKALSEKSKGRV